MSRASSALVDTRAVARARNGAAHQRQDVELRIVGGARRRARRHLHAAAARRDQADADLDAADVQLGRGAHRLTAQHHLGAAAQRQAERRRDDRHAGVAGAQEGVLEVDDHLVDDLDVLLAERHQQAEQVRARAERIGAVVTDDQPDAVALGSVDGLRHHGDDVGIDRVHLGVELEAEDAVAEVENRRAAVALHLATGGADRVERQGARVGRDLREAAALAELAGLAVLGGPIEPHAFTLRGDLLADPARHGVAGGLHLFRRRLDAQRVPGLERPALPAEAPAQRVVDVGHAVGDLAQAVGRVDQRFIQHNARQLGGTVICWPGDHAPNLLVDVVDAAGRADGVEARLLLRPVLERLQIDLQDVVADLLVEALLGLGAQPLLGDQLLQDGGGREHVAPLVVGHRLVAVVGHVQQCVQADDVGGAEDGALGPPGGGAEHHVDLLDGVALGHGLAQRAHHRERADAVGDEVGRVLRVHQPLAQEATAEGLGARERLRLGVGAGDDLDQLEVAGRVEEVGDAEPPAEVGAAPLHQVGDAQARRVRGDDRAAPHFIDPGVQLLLDRQVFDDGFDDHVAGGDRSRQVVLQVADADQRVEPGREERGRLGLARALEPGGRDLVARRAVAGGRVLGGDVEQPHAQPGIGEVRRDGRPHDTCSQYGHFADRQLGGHENTITAKRVAVEAARRKDVDR